MLLQPDASVSDLIPASVSVKPLENQQNHDVFQPVVRLENCSMCCL